MKTIVKILTGTLIFSALIFLVGCNTVKGAFQGAGEDTKALAHELQLDGSSSHQSHKKKVTTTDGAKTTTTTTTTTIDTTSSPTPAQ